MLLVLFISLHWTWIMCVFSTKVLAHLFSEIGMKLVTMLPGNSNKEKKAEPGL